MKLEKKLTKHGRSLALVIDKRLLSLLNIDAHTKLSITVQDRCIIVAPVHTVDRRKRFQGALAEANRKYAKALRRLSE
jgi:antitoxin component of MazEF toxin-antitoxin module